MDIYVARQPIFNQEKKIFGYELLFRDSMENVFSGIDGNTATSKVLSNSFLNIGIDKLIGKGVAFINFTKELLVSQLPKMFPSDQLVIEVLEDVDAEDEVVKSCIEMAEQGYTIALDDFFYNEGLEPLIAVANIIKFDLRATPLDEISELIDKLSGYNLKFLAEKVETYEEFDQALKMGFEYFQGYFFSKPQIISSKDIPGNKITTTSLGAIEDAINLYQGNLLEGWYQNWCLIERERLQQMYFIMLEKLMDFCEAHGEWERGQMYGSQILRYDNAHEPTHHRLMRLYYLSKDR